MKRVNAVNSKKEQLKKSLIRVIESHEKNNSLTFCLSILKFSEISFFWEAFSKLLNAGNKVKIIFFAELNEELPTIIKQSKNLFKLIDLSTGIINDQKKEEPFISEVIHFIKKKLLKIKVSFYKNPKWKFNFCHFFGTYKKGKSNKRNSKNFFAWKIDFFDEISFINSEKKIEEIYNTSQAMWSSDRSRYFETYELDKPLLRILEKELKINKMLEKKSFSKILKFTEKNKEDIICMESDIFYYFSQTPKSNYSLPNICKEWIDLNQNSQIFKCELKKIKKDINWFCQKKENLFMSFKLQSIFFNSVKRISNFLVESERIQKTDKNFDNIKNYFPEKFMEFQNSFNLLKRTPKWWQIIHSFFAIKLKKSLNFSSPGTGKTMTILMFFNYLKSIGKLKRLIIISPSSAVEPWRNEYYETFHKHPKVLSLFDKYSQDVKRRKLYETCDFEYDYIILHYNSLSEYKSELEKIITSEDCLIVDEAHKAKSLKSKNINALVNLSKKFKYTIMTTGTPAPNGLEDIQNMIKMTCDKNLYDFVHQWKIFEINKLINKLHVKITYGSEGVNLKYKQIDHKIEYELEENEKKLITDTIKDLKTNNFLKKIPTIKKILAGISLNSESTSLNKKSAKLKKTLEIIKQLVNKGKKNLVIWCSLIDSQNLIYNNLKKLFPDLPIYKHSGQASYEKRKDMIKKYKKNGGFFISTLQSLSESVSLHEITNATLYFEYDYDLVNWIQSRNRTYRLGIPNDMHYYIMVANNIDYERKVLDILLKKEREQKDIISMKLGSEELIDILQNKKSSNKLRLLKSESEDFEKLLKKYSKSGELMDFISKKNNIFSLNAISSATKISKEELNNTINPFKRKFKNFIARAISKQKNMEVKSEKEEFLLVINSFIKFKSLFYSPEWVRKNKNYCKIHLKKNGYVEKEKCFLPPETYNINKDYQYNDYLFIKPYFYFKYLLEKEKDKIEISTSVIEALNKRFNSSYNLRSLLAIIERQDWVTKAYYNIFIKKREDEKEIAIALKNKILENPDGDFVTKNTFFSKTDLIAKKYNLINESRYYILKKYYSKEFSFSTGNSMFIYIGKNKELAELPFDLRLATSIKEDAKILGREYLQKKFGGENNSIINSNHLISLGNNKFLFLKEKNTGLKIIKEELKKFLEKNKEILVHEDKLKDFLIESKYSFLKSLCELKTLNYFLKNVFGEKIKFLKTQKSFIYIENPNSE